MLYFKIALKNIRRAPYQALTAMLVMFLTFLALSVFLMVSFGSIKLLEFFESKPQVTVFIKDGAKEEEISQLEQSLKETGRIKNLKFVSKEEALEIYKKQNEADPILLELVTAEILPASLEISSFNPEGLAVLAEKVRDSEIIEDVIYQKDIIEELTVWTRGTRIVGLGVIGYMSLVSLLVMLVVIGMKASMKREEIEVMRLVGATNWFIRMPFVIEGLVYAVTAAFLVWLVSVIGVFQISGFLASFLQGTGLMPLDPWWFLYLLIFLLTGGLLVGGAGSLLVVWRYLK